MYCNAENISPSWSGWKLGIYTRVTGSGYQEVVAAPETKVGVICSELPTTAVTIEIVGGSPVWKVVVASWWGPPMKIAARAKTRKEKEDLTLEVADLAWIRWVGDYDGNARSRQVVQSCDTRIGWKSNMKSWKNSTARDSLMVDVKVDLDAILLPLFVLLIPSDWFLDFPDNSFVEACGQFEWKRFEASITKLSSTNACIQLTKAKIGTVSNSGSVFMRMPRFLAILDE